MKSISDFDLSGKRVLIRVDYNVPIREGRIQNDQRIRASIPTINKALEAGAGVVLVSHLGRPQEGCPDESLSLGPVCDYLASILKRSVRFETNWYEGFDISPGEVALLENIRFEVGESSNSAELSGCLARLCDIFVMDAFATAHRAHASTAGVAAAAKQACAGMLVEAEVRALDAALAEPSRPLVAVVGGAKVSTKLEVLNSLSGIADRIILGGGMANTLLLARESPIGTSLVEPKLVHTALELASIAGLYVPTDVVVAHEIRPDTPGIVRDLAHVGENESILDIGPVSARNVGDLLKEAGTIIWNGPMGMFELDQFGEGTRVVGEAIVASEAFSIAGGGDTIAAIEKYGLESGIDYISTAGGAFLEYLEGKVLPGIAALQ